MRREYKMKTQLTEKQIEEIWKSIYNENPSIKNALKEAREQNEIIQEYINSIFKGSKTELGQEIANTHAEAICNALTKLTAQKTTVKPTLSNSEKL